MFCDLVGSTALSARMDPEDLREVISAYQKCVAETVQRFGGFVAKYMGDGVNRQTTTLRAGGPIGRNASQRGNLRAWSVFSSACARQACLFDPYCHPRPRRAFNVVDCSFECDANAPPERRSRSASPRVLSPRVQPPWSGATPRRGSDQTDAASICAGSLEGSRDPLHVGNWSPCYLPCFGAACSGNLCCKRTK